MYRRVLIGGITAAAIVGAGGTALALSGSDQATPGSASGSSAPAHAGKHAGQHAGKNKNGKRGGKARLLRRLEHAQIVTKGKDGDVTHDLITGTVTAVSSTSITVQAIDQKSETFAITKDTKVRVRDAGQRSAATIDKVAEGDRVLVAGTGTSTYTAKHVIDIKTKK